MIVVQMHAKNKRKDSVWVRPICRKACTSGKVCFYCQLINQIVIILTTCLAAQKIKESLIHRAQIKKNYAKLKKQNPDQGPDDSRDRIPEPASLAIDKQALEGEPEGGTESLRSIPEPTTAPHPDRQDLMDNEPLPLLSPPPAEPRGNRRQRKPKTLPFRKEHEVAQRQRAEAEERQRAREQADHERTQKREERERFRKAMAKARTGGPNGQRKLGRESQVLLEKVKRMVEQ